MSASANSPRQFALDLVSRYYAAFNAGDREGMLDLLSDDIIHDCNQGGTEAGKDVFRKFMRHMDTCYAEQLADMVIMASDDGTRVAAEFTVHGTYLATDGGLPEATGQTYVLPAGAFLTVRDGKIARVTTYYNLPDWIRQILPVKPQRHD